MVPMTAGHTAFRVIRRPAPGRTGLRLETMEHGGEYPDTMPQAIKLIDAVGRIYVPITQNGKVVDSRGLSIRRMNKRRPARRFGVSVPLWPLCLVFCTGKLPAPTETHTAESASAIYSRIMDFELTGYNADDQELKLIVSSETEALATAITWGDQGLRDVTIRDADRACTITEFARRIINSDVRLGRTHRADKEVR
jgi:hypothetical protein